MSCDDRALPALLDQARTWDKGSRAFMAQLSETEISSLLATYSIPESARPIPAFGEGHEPEKSMTRQTLAAILLRERLSPLPWYAERAAKDGATFWQHLQGSQVMA